MQKIVCGVCQDNFENVRIFTRHLKKHKLTSVEHYDLYIKTPNEDICSCGTKTPFRGMIKGYQKHCSNKCSSKTALEKQWRPEISQERRKKLSVSMSENNISVGRPKGSKNKNEYPFTEKVIARLKMATTKTGKFKTYSGKFTPENPQKYIGDVNNITYRSSWERRVMGWLDKRPDVVSWCSEEIVIPYISPIDGKKHRYFPDFFVRVKTKDDIIRAMVIEVKPHKQTVEPKKKKRVTKQYIQEVVTYGINTAKWKAADEFCKDRGWTFKVLTEIDLNIK